MHAHQGLENFWSKQRPTYVLIFVVKMFYTSGNNTAEFYSIWFGLLFLSLVCF